jgi:hypothetical protein
MIGFPDIFLIALGGVFTQIFKPFLNRQVHGHKNFDSPTKRLDRCNGDWKRYQ